MALTRGTKGRLLHFHLEYTPQTRIFRLQRQVQQRMGSVPRRPRAAVGVPTIVLAARRFWSRTREDGPRIHI